jgi:SAM-dependent methyltransferase
MLEDPACAVCGNKRWRLLGRKSYAKADMEGMEPSLRSRYQILFGTWFEGRETAEIAVSSCGDCGFVAFAPRPTDADVTSKYEMSLTLPRTRKKPPADNAADRHRAKMLAADLKGHITPGSRILDVGGGDGRLMSELVTDGHRAFVVDFKPTPVKNVTRLGSTIADLDPEERFDVCVLSHVLEHVAEPFELFKQLKQHLTSSGHLLVEVPMELLGRVPPRREPLTHINFFHTESLRALAMRAGLLPVSCYFAWHYNQKQIVVRAVLRNGGAAALELDGRGDRMTQALVEGDVRPLADLVRDEPRRTLKAALFHTARSIGSKLKSAAKNLT